MADSSRGPIGRKERGRRTAVPVPVVMRATAFAGYGTHLLTVAVSTTLPFMSIACNERVQPSITTLV